jgi:hypothetical protein
MSRSIPLTRGAFALVDEADFGWLTQWCWRLNSHGYAIRSIYVEEHEVHFSMHRVIMNAQRGQFVDHIDHNRLNNTRANLRFVTFQENMRYRRCYANNRAGFKGVSARRQRWQARIGLDEDIIHLGYFATPEIAAQAYDAAAKRLFGAFALLNLPDHETPLEVEAVVEAALARAGIGG